MPGFEAWCAAYREDNPDAKCDYKSVTEWRKKNPERLKVEKPKEIKEELQEVEKERKLGRVKKTIQKEKVKEFLLRAIEQKRYTKGVEANLRRAAAAGVPQGKENAIKVSFEEAKEIYRKLHPGSTVEKGQFSSYRGNWYIWVDVEGHYREKTEARYEEEMKTKAARAAKKAAKKAKGKSDE